MIEIRPYSELGGARHGWLDTRHHFSIADYHDPERMHWGNLRAWNDDTNAPRSGFPCHPHRDMEIITCVRKGAITHEDSPGRTEAGDGTAINDEQLLTVSAQEDSEIVLVDVA